MICNRISLDLVVVGEEHVRAQMMHSNAELQTTWLQLATLTNAARRKPLEHIGYNISVHATDTIVTV